MTAAVLTPMANPTVETEFRRLLPLDFPWVTGRLVSAEPDPLKRLIAYADGLGASLAQFDTLPLSAVAFACTGSSYLLGPGRERTIAAQLTLPVVWAAGAVRARLEALGARRIAVVSPSPPALHAAGLAYWRDVGLEVIHDAQVEIGSADTRAIYALGPTAPAGAVREARGARPDAILLAGTGMPTLDLLDDVHRRRHQRDAADDHLQTMGQAEPGVSDLHLPLTGFRIVSAEQYGAGPYGTMFLAQLGAEVIKIEPPHRDGKGGGDTARAVGPHFLREGESLYFQSFNLNKKSLTLDLSAPEGQVVLRRLIADAHGMINNLRGDLPARLGLTYDALRAINPGIVCAHLSAYGRENARARWPGYDYLMQAEAGYCALTGDPDGEPQRMGLSMVDFITGTIMATGFLAALVDAQRSGTGRDVDTDLLSAAVHQTSYPALWYMNEGAETRRTPRSVHPTATPSQMVRTRDGWMFVMCQLPKFWDIMVDRLGRPDLASDPRFATNADRLAHRDVLTRILDAHFGAHPMAHWQALLEGHVPVAPVYELAAALDSPWLRTIGMRDTIPHPDKPAMDVLANPLQLDGERLPNRAAPLLGADSNAILSELGYSAAEVEKLRADGIV